MNWLDVFNSGVIFALLAVIAGALLLLVAKKQSKESHTKSSKR
ncbi:MAG: hypothetical protein AAB553_02750 [Patescibacteria group bacterium]